MLKKRLFWIFFTILIAYFTVIWWHMLEVRPDGLYAGHPYIWADWSLHLALASNFAFRPISAWFSSYPIYSGAKLTYPFVADLISGMLLRFALGYQIAFLVPSLLTTILMLSMLYRYFALVLQRKSLSLLAIVLFFCGGGIGAVLLMHQHGIAPVLFDSTIVTTQIPELSIETNTVIPSMLLPQRAFLLGLPVGLFILLTLISAFGHPEKPVHKRTLIVAGVLAGLLPIIHTHTFLVIVLFSVYWFAFSLKKISAWLWYGIPAVTLSLLVYMVFLHESVSASHFFSLHLGWVAPPGALSWLIFWIKNWGIFPIGAFIGTVYLWWLRKTQFARLSLFFWGVFALANCIQFQPQLWDNTKMFTWAYLGLCPAFAFACYMFWKQRPYQYLRRAVVCLVIFCAIFSGSLDVIHTLDFDKKSFRMLSTDQIAMGEWARKTPPESIFLTAEEVGNPIAMIGGRSVILGYSGWAFSYGLPYQARQQDIPLMYQDQEQARQLFKTYGVSYIVVSADEASLAPMQAAFAAQYPVVFQNDYGKVYQINQL